jgi:hypothetical protein
VRGLLGHSFVVGTWPAFFDMQVAQRFRAGGAPDEFRADIEESDAFVHAAEVSTTRMKSAAGLIRPWRSSSVARLASTGRLK